jgi:hypothetical protein
VVPDGAGRLVERFRAPVGTASKFAAPGVGRGRGRAYVGARDGAVYGFGAPVAPALAAAPTDFGAAPLGQGATKTVTLTAQKETTITAVGASNAAFAVGAIAPALPAALAAGATLAVEVTFTPASKGVAGGTVNVTTTGEGVSEFALAGTGQAPGPELAADKSIVSFGGVAAGGALTGSVTFRNRGAQPLAFDGFVLPAAPFGASGLPAAGATLAPGGAVTAAVSFSPTAAGEYNGALTLRSSGGDVTVALSGNAPSAGRLVVSAVALDAGDVALGASRALSFTLTNAGGADVTITKSKTPALGPFAAVTALNEGTKNAAGRALTETVLYAPAGLGADRDARVINSDDASGLRQIVLSGFGVEAAALDGFSLNGSAALAGESIVLTPAAPLRAGSAFWPRAPPADGLTVSFDASLGGGSGADGLALVFADPARGVAPDSLGGPGGGLGFAGLPGVAVALDTYRNDGDPSANFVGVAAGDGPGGGFGWIATNAGVPGLRERPRHVTVAVRGGALLVYLDGALALETPVALPPAALVGFTAGTGGAEDEHAVSNVSLTGFGAHVNFQPAGPPAFPGYAVDAGAAYGARDGGLAFGWSGDNGPNARRRDAPDAPDARFDTLLHMQKPSLPDAC